MKTYSVLTYDGDAHAYTPQARLGMPSIGVGLWQVKRVLRRLKEMGYSCHRYRDAGCDEVLDSDAYVLVQRTDGWSRREILNSGKR